MFSIALSILYLGNPSLIRIPDRSMSGNNTILITGAGGFLGSLVSDCDRMIIRTIAYDGTPCMQLARALHTDPQTPDIRLVLVDIVEPKAPAGSRAVTIKADLTDPPQVDALFQTEYGIPDTVYCLHGIMSRGSEDNFDFGVKVIPVVLS